MMKRIFTILLILTSLSVQAQTEDVPISFDDSSQKDFGGFLLDMSAMLNTDKLTLPPVLPSLNGLSLWTPEITVPKINPDALAFTPKVTYYKGSMQGFSGLYTRFGAVNMTWQGASYRLKNGLRINTYGEYNADGHKMYNPSAMPWQRNNFNAAFEVKSADGSFGIKLEVHGGRNNPY